MVLWGLFWEWQSQLKLKSWGWCLHLLWTSDTPCDKNKCKTEMKGKTMAFCNFYKSYCFLAMIRFNKMYPLQESLWKTWGDLNIWPGQEKDLPLLARVLQISGLQIPHAIKKRVVTAWKAFVTCSEDKPTLVHTVIWYWDLVCLFLHGFQTPSWLFLMIHMVIDSLLGIQLL